MTILAVGESGLVALDWINFMQNMISFMIILEEAPMMRWNALNKLKKKLLN